MHFQASPLKNNLYCQSSDLFDLGITLDPNLEIEVVFQTVIMWSSHFLFHRFSVVTTVVASNITSRPVIVNFNYPYDLHLLNVNVLFCMLFLVKSFIPLIQNFNSLFYLYYYAKQKFQIIS